MTIVNGIKDHKHQVLIAGSIPDQSVSVGPLLEKLGIQFTHVKNSEAGLKEIEKATIPFSLVICDQRMDGLQGTEFLSRVKEASPGTIRFLITGYSQLDIIISAVNKGAVHRYISKPWEPDQMVEALKSGLSKYERHLDSGRLFALAKTQNGKLYELNCELMEATKRHDQESKKLEKEIHAIAAQLKEKTAKRPLKQKQLAKKASQYLEACETDKKNELDNLYEQVLLNIFQDFTELALRNGIELTEPGTPDKKEPANGQDRAVEDAESEAQQKGEDDG